MLMLEFSAITTQPWEIRCVHAADAESNDTDETEPQTANSSTNSDSAKAAPTSDMERARSLYIDGTAYFEDEDYQQAAETWLKADNLAPSASLKYNIAVAWDRSQQFDRAATAYRVALISGLKSVQYQDAKARLEALRQSLATVIIDSPEDAELSVGPYQSIQLPTTLFLKAGSYEFVVSQEGSTASTTVRVSARKTVHPQLLAPLSNSKIVENTDVENLRDQEKAAAEASHLQETLGWVGIGLGITGVAFATGFGIAALNANQQFNDSGNQDEAARESAVNNQTASNVSWISAGVFAVGGTALLFTAPTFHF